MTVMTNSNCVSATPAFIKELLHLADDALILAQRNSEYCGHGPVLEQDIAITNISLDLLGQARYLYQYAARLMNETGDATLAANAGVPGTQTEDSLAYLRTEREFLNCLLVEQPNGDWAQTILRQFFFSLYQQQLFQQLLHHGDTGLAAIAGKSLKEVMYHVRWSSEWVIRLGDGTVESHRRMEAAIGTLWTYTGELFAATEYEEASDIDLASLRLPWDTQVRQVFDEATLPCPAKGYMQEGGKLGRHTEYLGFILAELQYMQRTYPGCEW